MFDFAETFKIHPSKVVVTDIDGIVIRRCRFTLERDFDEATATGMGATAKEALALVEDSRVEKVVIKLDAIDAEMKLKGPKSEVTIGKATGVKATATAPKVPKNEDDDEGPPKIKLEFETGLTEEVWLFLGKNAGSWADVVVRKNQLDLPFEGAPAAAEGKSNGSGNGAELADSLRAVSGQPPKATLKPPRGKGKKAAAPADAQAAANPEEAELVREQRLREERAENESAWDDEPEQKAAGATPTEPLAF